MEFSRSIDSHVDFFSDNMRGYLRTTLERFVQEIREINRKERNRANEIPTWWWTRCWDLSVKTDKHFKECLDLQCISKLNQQSVQVILLLQIRILFELPEVNVSNLQYLIENWYSICIIINIYANFIMFSLLYIQKLVKSMFCTCWFDFVINIAFLLFIP